MKNKNVMLLLGIGVAYLIYKIYANKNTTGVIKTPVSPNLLYPVTDNITTNSIPSQFLVDSVNTAEVSYEPSTYQTFYGSMAGNKYKVPSTC
jgi:hypothetical protein